MILMAQENETGNDYIPIIPLVDGELFGVDRAHSYLGFSIGFLGLNKVRGHFNKYDMAILYNEADLSKMSLTLMIDASSIDTRMEMRDKDLRGDRFFDVEKYPTITFESSRIFPYEDYYLAIGQFSMHGVTKEILLPFELLKADGNTLGFKVRTKINRIDFGVGKDFEHTSIPNFLGDELDVNIDFWTKKAKKD